MKELSKPFRVLHVEDDASVADLTTTFIERESDSITVVTEATAADGLDRLATDDIDCVVSDYKLPGMDGIEFLRAAREVSDDIPFILFTGKGDEDVASTAFSAGATDYVQKDTQGEQYQTLARLVRNTLERHQASTDYHEIFENVPDGIMVFDPTDGSVLDVNRQLPEMLGYSREEFLDMGIDALRVVDSPYSADRAEDLIRQAATDAPQTFDLVTKTKEGTVLPVEVHLCKRTLSGRKRILVVVRDVGEDDRGEAQIKRDRERLRVLFENSPMPIMYGVLRDGEPIVQDVNPAFEATFGVDADAVESENLDDYIVPEDVDNADLNRRIATEGSVQAEIQRQAADGLRDFQLQTAVVPSYGADWTCEGWAVYTDITEQKERERQLQRQRDELESLTRLNALIADVIQVLVSSSTREDIEDVVCERLSKSERYSNALILERDADGNGVTVRASEGLDASYVQSITERSADDVMNADLERVLEDGPVTVTRQTMDASETPDPIRGLALSHGYRATVIVPLSYGNTVYGALLVNDARADAFSEYEQNAFEVLGDVVGFAINATNNRKILLSDIALEIELEVTDSNSFFVAASDRLGCTFTLEGVVPQEDQTLLCYLSVDGASPDAVREAIADEPNVTDPRIISADGDQCFLECAVSGSSGVLKISEYGATVKSARFDDGTGTVVVHLAPDADVRSVVTMFRDAFPDSRLVGKRTVERPVRTRLNTYSEMSDRMTDKQEQVLRSAFFSGYFDTPRGTTAQELAASLGIASSTLHQHLQAALRKTLGEVIE